MMDCIRRCRRRSRHFDEASAALGDDLWQMVADGPAELLSQTVNTQPVMLTAGIAAWRLWLEKGGRKPAVVASHSLGEYAALVAAGVLALKDAVPLVRLRAARCRKPCRWVRVRWPRFLASTMKASVPPVLNPLRVRSLSRSISTPRARP